jgi:chemotaxis protein methyltransferase CheR
MADAPKRWPRLEPDEFRIVRDLVRRMSGIRLGDDMREAVERRLYDRLQALALPNYTEYCRYLRDGAQGKNELERATELLATNETYFFRELPQLRAFEREVLPRLQALGRVKQALTIWSAGCSTGEEAYTIAILIARSGLFTGWNVRVIGSDISRRVLHVARKGVYRAGSFRALPLEYERHFLDTPDGRAVEPAIRALCQFGHFNLLDASRAVIIGRVDAIFCRNVLIYFDEETRKKAVEAFYERLQPGGYLMLGHSESLLQSSSPFEVAQLSGDLVYRKPLTADGRQSNP